MVRFNIHFLSSHHDIFSTIRSAMCAQGHSFGQPIRVNNVVLTPIPFLNCEPICIHLLSWLIFEFNALLLLRILLTLACVLATSRAFLSAPDFVPLEHFQNWLKDWDARSDNNQIAFHARGLSVG